MPEEAPREDHHVRVAVLGPLGDEREAAVSVRPAAAPARPVLAALPQLDDGVGNGVARAVEHPPDDAHGAAGHDLVLRPAGQADREERPDRLRGRAAARHSNGVRRRTMSKR